MADHEETVIDAEPVNDDAEDRAEPQPRSLVVAPEVLPEALLVVPLTERPLFPRMMGPVLVHGDPLKRAVGAALESGQQVVGLLLVREAGDAAGASPPGAPPTLHTVGVAARIARAAPVAEGGPLQLLVQAMERFSVDRLAGDGGVTHARVHYWWEAEHRTNAELKAYSVAIIDAIKELVKLNPLYKEGLALLLEQLDVNDPGMLADFAASMTTASGEELQEILAERSVRHRIEKALVLIKREVEVSRLKGEISHRIEERLSKQQREFFLKEQLKEIKKELGLAKEDTETEVEKLRGRLEGLTLTDEARERIDEELGKLAMLEPSSPEFAVSRAYLDWLTILPWGVYTEDSYDLARAAQVLDEDHYGLADVKDRILELISVGIVKGDLAGSIILLVGPPGVGKTSVGRSIANALGRRFYRFSLGGMRDEAEIKGHRRTYIGAMPGKFIQAIKVCRSANPLIMLDEVDKIGASFQGDPASALLEVLDPEQNRDFLDHYLDVRFDLSKVLFVCTANQLETIPRPLLDRTEVIRIPGYILDEKLEIARRHLVPKQLREHGLKRGQVSLSKAVLRDIIDGWAREAGVRSLENQIKKILRKSVKRMIEEGTKKVTVRRGDLHDLLGRRVFADEQVFATPRAGVVTGLAYTTMGGATLFIEAAAIPAKGPGFKQTGQLGDVMRESSEIAYSLVRALLGDDTAARELFEKHVIHLHVPAGATPKDGPSAGITMAAAIYSLATGQKPRAHLAMTGELTLSGLVMPIGGVKEKIIAARRAGIRDVILPAENREDFEDLPEHLGEGLAPHFVKTFDDVRAVCFPNDAKRKEARRKG